MDKDDYLVLRQHHVRRARQVLAMHSEPVPKPVKNPSNPQLGTSVAATNT